MRDKDTQSTLQSELAKSEALGQTKVKGHPSSLYSKSAAAPASSSAMRLAGLMKQAEVAAFGSLPSEEIAAFESFEIQAASNSSDPQTSSTPATLEERKRRNQFMSTISSSDRDKFSV